MGENALLFYATESREQKTGGGEDACLRALHKQSIMDNYRGYLYNTIWHRTPGCDRMDEIAS